MAGNTATALLDLLKGELPPGFANPGSLIGESVCAATKAGWTPSAAGMVLQLLKCGPWHRYPAPIGAAVQAWRAAGFPAVP